jgi:hypothetical protein
MNGRFVWSLVDEKLAFFLYEEFRVDKPVTLSPSLCVCGFVSFSDPVRYFLSFSPDK